MASSKSRNWWPPQPFTNRPMSNRPEAATNLLQACASTQTSRSFFGDPVSKDNDEVAEMLDLLNSLSSSQNEPRRPDLLSMNPANLATVLRVAIAEHQHGTQPAEDSGVAGPVVEPSPSAVLAENTDRDDAPLVSKRAACIPVTTRIQGGMHTGDLSSLSMAPAALFRPHPSWGYQASCILYIAVFLTPDSREVLLSMIPPKHPCIFADHMTLAYKPGIQQVLGYPLGAEVELRVVGAAENDRVQAVSVDPPSWLPPTNSTSTHITISVAVGSRAVEGGHLIVEAMQQIAADDQRGLGPGDTSQACTFVPLGEPLPLVGKLGVMVKAKSASGLGLGDTVAIYTIEDLDKGGYVSLCAENLELYHQQHDAILAKQVQQCKGYPRSAFQIPDSITQRQHAPASPAAVSSVQKLPPSLASVSPCSAHVATRLTMEVSGLSPTAMSAPQLLQSEGATSGQLTNDVPDGNESDSGSSDSMSNIDVVQFKSAVHVGDYVALRPFVHDQQMVRGYVREYACDDPFQGDGVLVVLADNTIGFVTAVLESDTTSESSNLSSIEAPIKSNSGCEQSTSKSQKTFDGATTGSSGGCGIGHVRPGVKPGHAIRSDTNDLDEWSLVAPAAAISTASTAGPDVPTTEDAQHDLQLWAEFESLQKQYGESLCNVILDSCNQDFKEAITLIQAQAAKPNTSASALAPAASAKSECSIQSGPEEDLAQQWALSFGLSPHDALQLCRLAPHKSTECVIEALLQHNGDVSKAADALLSGNGGSRAPNVGSTHSNVLDSACDELLGSKGDTIALTAMRLCQLFPSLTQDTAKMLLLEHGGSYDKAAESVSEMQMLELEARTGAAAGLRTRGLSQPRSDQCQSLEQVSEEDQMAMLVALGLLDDTTHRTPRDASMTSGSEGQAAMTLPPISPVPPPPPPPTAKHHQQRLVSSPKFVEAPTPASSSGTSSYSPLGILGGECGLPPRPGLLLDHRRPSGKLYLPQARKQMEESAERRAKNAARDAADKLYAKSKSLNKESELYMTAGQALLDAGDLEGYREKKQAADKARAKGRAAFEEAQRLFWTANNKSMQTWTNDLHGLGTTKALRRFVDTLQSLLSMDNPGGVVYHVITGKGKHSDDNVPIIKLNVLKYLEERASQVLAETKKPWGVTWRIDPSNEGCVEVHIPGSGTHQDE